MRASVKFVQIGANDGRLDDSLRDVVMAYAWHGVLVEPAPHLQSALRASYHGNDRVQFESAAISSEPGEMRLYYIAQLSGEELPWWAAGVISPSREVVEKHLPDSISAAEAIREVRVEKITPDVLWAKYRAHDVEVLQIDTEGHDLEILKGINFACVQPQLLIFEHHHLPPEERQQAMALVRAAGYGVVREGLDTICMHEATLRTRGPRLLRFLWWWLCTFPVVSW